MHTIALLSAISCSHSQSRPMENYTEIERCYYQLKSVNTDADKEAMKSYVCDSLNFTKLYNSPLWDTFIEDWINLFGNNVRSFPAEEFTYISKRILERIAIESPEVSKPLVRKSADILMEMDQKKVAACLAAYSHGININANEDSEIAMRLLTAIMLPGTKAPALTGTKPAGNNTEGEKRLIIFYDSNCPDCESLLANVSSRYKELLNKGIDIISLSADTDEILYTKHAKRLPWKNKLCDYQSFSSDNFKNYGIAAVPAMYLIDSKGLIVDRFESLDEFDLLKHDGSDINTIDNEEKALH